MKKIVTFPILIGFFMFIFTTPAWACPYMSPAEQTIHKTAGFFSLIAQIVLPPIFAGIFVVNLLYWRYKIKDRILFKKVFLFSAAYMLLILLPIIYIGLLPIIYTHINQTIFLVMSILIVSTIYGVIITQKLHNQCIISSFSSKTIFLFATTFTLAFIIGVSIAIFIIGHYANCDAFTRNTL